MNDVREYFQRDLTEYEARQIVALTGKVWPDSPNTINCRLKYILGAAASDDPEQRDSKRFVVWENDAVIAHARTFRRRIYVNDQTMDILALASVCTDETVRGRGLGLSIVRKAFEQVDLGEFKFSLFQTGVPQFYEKLNCRLVDNKIVDRTNFEEPEKNPFWDPFVMIYPANENWPAGIVDLNGKGY